MCSSLRSWPVGLPCKERDLGGYNKNVPQALLPAGSLMLGDCWSLFLADLWLRTAEVSLSGHSSCYSIVAGLSDPQSALPDPTSTPVTSDLSADKLPVLTPYFTH